MRNRPGPNNRVSAWNRRGRGPENNVCRVAPFLFSQYIARMLWRVRSSGQAVKRTCCFHSSTSSNRRQAAPNVRKG